jgi:hypothetical protein
MKHFVLICSISVRSKFIHLKNQFKFIQLDCLKKRIEVLLLFLLKFVAAKRVYKIGISFQSKFKIICSRDRITKINNIHRLSQIAYYFDVVSISKSHNLTLAYQIVTKNSPERKEFNKKSFLK